MRDKTVLFSAREGPESLEIYTSEDQAIVDDGVDIPGLYIKATLMGAAFYLGPFCCSSIRKAAEAVLLPAEDPGMINPALTDESIPF